MRLSIIDNLQTVPAEEWNALAGADIPFLSHEFLSALERHHCVGAAAGWTPQHLLLYDAGSNVGDNQEKLVGAVPQYLKTNSYGELVFDWSWADAYQRHGVSYYPKFVTAIPFTPCPGPRICIAPDENADDIYRQLAAYVPDQAQKLNKALRRCMTRRENAGAQNRVIAVRRIVERFPQYADSDIAINAACLGLLQHADRKIHGVDRGKTGGSSGKPHHATAGTGVQQLRIVVQVRTHGRHDMLVSAEAKVAGQRGDSHHGGRLVRRTLSDQSGRSRFK